MHTTLIGKPGVNRPLGRPWHRFEYRSSRNMLTGSGFGVIWLRTRTAAGS